MFRWFKKKNIEKRIGFTDILLTNQFALATDSTAQAAESSAVEIAAGFLRRSFWSTEISGTDLIDQEMLAYIGNDLVRYGNSVWGMVQGKYLRSYSYDVQGDSYHPNGWTYYLTFPSPSKTGIEASFRSQDCLHFKQNVTVQRPWMGLAPVQSALPVSELVAKMEQSLSQEAGTTTGHLLPIPKDGGDEALSSIREQLKNLNGKVALVESTRSFSEDSRSAPRGDWESKRLGMQFDNSTASVYREALISTLGVIGLPYEVVFSQSGGTGSREAYRRALHNFVKPMGRLIQHEFKMKTGIELKLDYTDLQASDIAGRARAFGILTKNGLSQDTALKIIGIDSKDTQDSM